MFYGNDCYRAGGMIADYRLDCPMKQKSIDFYVQDVPLVYDEAAMLQTLYAALPKGLPYGIRVRKWSDFYPDAPWVGELVGYTTVNDLGEAVVTFFAYDNFVMADTPWEDIVA